MSRLWFSLFLVMTMACHAPQKPSALQPTSLSWEKEIRAFEEPDRNRPPPRDAILFLGSSSIRMWNSLANDFPEHEVINRGFGGSQIIDSVYYADRIIFPYQPRQVVFYAGGNDINAGKSPGQVFADFRLLGETLWRRQPRTQLAYISIAPNPKRWEQIEKTREVNRLVKNWSARESRLVFIDISREMLGPDGLPRPEIFLPDRLHMNNKGYEIWKRVLQPYLN